MENTRKFRLRSFASTTMFLFVIILTVTGIIIQTTDSMGGNYETPPAGLVSTLHFVTAVHVLTGFAFAILSVIHIVLNWKTLKNYLKKGRTGLSKEVVLACLLGAVILVATVIIIVVLKM